MEQAPIYVVGAPRSGTSIFGDVLDRHPQVAHWMEPYFIYDFHTGYGADDVRTAADPTPAVTRFIRRETERFARWKNREALVIKNLETSFRIPFVEQVHPEARYIHIVRDPRDVALSLRQRKRQRETTMTRMSLKGLAAEAWDILRYHHPYHQLLLIAFELKTRRSLNPRALFQKSKWEGLPYFGPRPPGWREAFAGRSDLEIGALQWAMLEKQLQPQLAAMADGRVHRLSYEGLLADPEGTLADVFRFIGVDTGPAAKIARDLDAGNTGKWRSRMTEAEKQAVAPILDPLLSQLGYPATA